MARIKNFFTELLIADDQEFYRLISIDQQVKKMVL